MVKNHLITVVWYPHILNYWYFLIALNLRPMSKTSQSQDILIKIRYWGFYLLSISCGLNRFWTGSLYDYKFWNAIFLVFDEEALFARSLCSKCVWWLWLELFRRLEWTLQCIECFLLFIQFFAKRCQMDALALLQVALVLMKIGDKLCILPVLTTNLSALHALSFSCSQTLVFGCWTELRLESWKGRGAKHALKMFSYQENSVNLYFFTWVLF